MGLLFANLTTTLKCGNETNPINCGFVNQPTVRGSTQIIITFLVPMISTAFGTLFMNASLAWWRKGMDFVLRLFFPEISLWHITEEEILRTQYLKHLHAIGFLSATRQQLMSIQQGKLFLAGPRPTIEHELPESNYGMKGAPAVSAQDITVLDEPQAAIRWCSETPNEGCIQLKIENVRAYQHLLGSLPTGKQTWKGIGYPDIGTSLLTLQLIWLLTTIALRLASGYKVSLLELYCLFSLVAFVAERIVTQLNIPAWSQSVVVCAVSSAYNSRIDSMDKKLLPETWKGYFTIIPLLQFLGWPVFMFVYAAKSGPHDGAGLTSITNAVCFAAGGVYCSAFLWAFVGSALGGSKSWGFLKYGPFAIAGFAFFLSKFLVFFLGITQALQGDRDIFLVPAKQWNIPHISG
ncbi:hypothetical protein B0O99DRAFT_693979 [Bisporella sp. PMI_857]|nr:hypothetical protein B0O99DRAFT_693979 [Bisporella sp. PMI_857]